MSKKDAEVTEAVSPVEDSASAEPTVEDSVPAVQQSRFARLYDEAMENFEPGEPYPFDFDPSNIIYITRPDETERALALAKVVDDRGNIDVDGLLPLLESLCGQQFPAMWRILRDMPLEVTIRVVMDMQDWFFGNAAKGTSRLPGGSQDSSS